MQTNCSDERLLFQGFGSRRVEGAFDGGEQSSDSGLLLLREVAERTRLIRRFAACFTDHRRPERIEHTVEQLLGQRVFGQAQGYEDLNDHDRLRDDPLLALAAGKPDLVGAERRQARDRGHALAGRSTLNRLERTAAEPSRYHRIVHDDRAIEDGFVDHFLDAHHGAPSRIVLDLDATDDPLYGEQEGRFFHGYYRHYCYLPLYIFCGGFVLWSELRPSNIDAAAGTVEALERIVGRIRARWGEGVEIWIRADSGFARESIMAWCEANGVEYVLGLARNARLVRAIGGELEAVREEVERTGRSARRYRELRYRTRKSWSRERRVVAKAEHLRGKANPRFVVTSLGPKRLRARVLYERTYCARGDMENRIKEQQLGMFADRTSTQTMRANQLRLWIASMAYTLVHDLRRLGLEGTSLAKAQVDTIRTRLLKLSAVVRISVRRVRIAFASSFPLRDLFRQVLHNLKRAAPLQPT